MLGVPIIILPVLLAVVLLCHDEVIWAIICQGVRRFVFKYSEFLSLRSCMLSKDSINQVGESVGYLPPFSFDHICITCLPYVRGGSVAWARCLRYSQSVIHDDSSV